MKIFFVAYKYLLELSREIQLLGLVFALPLLFTLITYIGYGTSYKLATYAVIVVDTQQRGAGYVQILADQRYPDGRPIFSILPYLDLPSAIEGLKQKKAVVCLNFITDEKNILTASLVGDATNISYIQSSTRLENILGSLMEKEEGKPAFLIFDHENINLHAPQTEFDAYMPGMIVFAILLLIPQTAMLIGREKRAGLFTRLSMSRLKSWEFIAGISLAQIIIAILQVLILYTSAVFLGFHLKGSIWLGLAISILLCLSTIIMGLIAGYFVENDSEAINSGSMICMIQVFLSGSFFAMPAPVVFNIGNHRIGLFDFIPATHGMLALQQILISGASAEQVQFQILAMCLLTAFILVFCLCVYTVKRSYER